MNVIGTILTLIYIWFTIAALSIILKDSTLTKKWLNISINPFKKLISLVKNTSKEVTEEIKKEEEDKLNKK